MGGARNVASVAMLCWLLAWTGGSTGHATATQNQPPAPVKNVRVVRSHPLISDVAASGVSASTATIRWTTNQPSDSLVEYGLTTSYGNVTPVNSSLVTAHSMTLTGLSSSATYHFRVRSRNVAGMATTSPRYTFITAPLPDVIPPTVALTAPGSGATVSGTLAISASASDNTGVTAVQFTLDGANFGAPDSTAPYSIDWNTTTAANGHHTLAATARDAAGNVATAAAVSVTVSNSTLPSLVIRPQDTSINLNATNYSSSPTLTTYTWPDRRVANAIVMTFDLSSLPAGAVVQDATLTLGLVESDATADATYLISAHKVVGRNPVISAATGYTSDGATAWTANACCSGSVPLAQADISAAYDTRAIDKTPGLKSWTLTAMVQEWLSNPGSNFGLLLNSDATKLADRYRYFASMEHADSTLQPSLRVSYTVASPDTTPPSVAMTAPAQGTTLSGTVTVSASASDDVQVAGVQFKLDGVKLGSEDLSAPYSVSWNTTSAPNGAHTLTAVARDAAGNQRTSVAVSVTVSNAAPPPSGSISALYPGDVGIETHPDVIFTEMFEQSSIATMTSRYNDVAHPGGMTFAASVPMGSSGTRSLQMTTNGTNESAGLYKTFANGQQWYLRYYVNYNSSVQYGHTSAWLGGYNPMLTYPNPQAGSKPAGNDRFSTGIEPQSFDNDRWMSYTYWKDMRVAGDGKFWGNVLQPNDPTIRMDRNRWYCVETMVKLNSPVTDSNGELAMWIDGTKVLHLGKGFPNGTWSGGIFTENAAGSPFSGFQWRSDPALNLNWIWLQNYVTGVPSSVQFDHVVLARSYIGCLGSGSSDTTPPAVSLSAPAAGATVSGTATTVSASATDAGGIAGVQFKLDGANLGAEDTTAPYSVPWNTTLTPNGSHTLTAVARDTAGNTATSSPVTVTVGNTTPVPSVWPNEPTGFTLLNDQPWNLLTGNGWNYLRRSSSKDASIVTDSTAPLSPSNVMRMVFTTDMQRDSEPSVHWMGLSGVKEIYTAWWMKVSPNWSCSAAGCGKLTFLFTSTGGQVYTNIYHPPSSNGPPFQVGANTEWAPYGQRIWLPNVTTTLVHPGQWHRIEFYYRWETTPGVSQDGIIRWWVDGMLNGNHTNVHYPATSFNEFQFAPTLQSPPPAEQYMYIDHTRVSRKQ